MQLEPFKKFDRFAGKQSVRVSRTAVVEAALAKFLDEQDAADQKPQRKGKK